VRIARFAVADEVAYGLVGTARAGSAAAGGEVIAELAGHPLGAGKDGIRLTGTTYLLDEVRLLAPVLPSKVIGFSPAGPGPGARADDGLDDGSVMYLKPSTAVCGPSDAIQSPAQTQRLEAGARLAVVIGRLCRQVPREQAAAAVFGYACALDVTAADLRERDGQWARAKGFDTFCPLGPWIETDAPGAAELVTAVNGQARQRGRMPGPAAAPVAAASVEAALVAAASVEAALVAAELVAAELVAAASSVMTLLPGDVLLAGAGAGDVALECGDEVSVSIDGIGTLTNRVEKGD
jgi:2-keto-4-pentenoate hydratase/2-oxohepta-3-ene-1,7-dioic acid hydratase in catechol pathway